MEIINLVQVDHQTKKNLFGIYPECNFRQYLGNLMAIDDITDYAKIVRYETMRVHLEQIKNTIAFMVNYSGTYFIDTKYSMRFVNTLIIQQEKDHRDLNKMLPVSNNPLAKDILNEQCLDDFVKYVFLICKRNPTLIELKRYVIKVEIDQQIVKKQMDEEILIWENNRNNIV